MRNSKVLLGAAAIIAWSCGNSGARAQGEQPAGAAPAAARQGEDPGSSAATSRVLDLWLILQRGSVAGVEESTLGVLDVGPAATAPLLMILQLEKSLGKEDFRLSSLFLLRALSDCRAVPRMFDLFADRNAGTPACRQLRTGFVNAGGVACRDRRDGSG